MDELFQQFLKERRYLRNSATKTLSFYEQSWKCYKRFSQGISQTELNNFVIGMRQRGLSIGACNVYIRGMNCFLGWLHENGHEKLRIKLLKEDKKVLKTFSDSQLKAMIAFKPKKFSERRLHALVLLLMDCGLRIDEALSLKRGAIDFDNLLIKVKGKGSKERIVPFSIEYRKALFKFLRTHQFDYVFPNRRGGKLLYDNCRRDLNSLMEKLGITGFDGAFHAFRRCFAKNYVRNGGNLFYLQQAMGHATLEQTKAYVEVEVEALQATHAKTSILNRLR